MDKTDHTPAVTIAPGAVPMARIDGEGVRRLRESKGLTQLYLATFIGVTTDTISRWEHRRYPSIKLDNAEKLAQALEVELAAILELEASALPPTPDGQEAAADPPPMPPPPPATPTEEAAPLIRTKHRPIPPWLLALLLIIILGGLASLLLKPASPTVTVAAQRILPDHIPADQTFPVLILVTTSQQAPVALILKETIPPGCVVVSAEPPLTSAAGKGGILKWVSRTDQQQTIFAYLLRAPTKGSDGDQLRFSGEVTPNQSERARAEIGGAATMTIAPYHWADVNLDNMIDDEEILAVYDQYSALAPLDFDRDLIDSLWASKGYVWNRKTGKYAAEK